MRKRERDIYKEREGEIYIKRGREIYIYIKRGRERVCEKEGERGRIW